MNGSCKPFICKGYSHIFHKKLTLSQRRRLCHFYIRPRNGPAWCNGAWDSVYNKNHSHLKHCMTDISTRIAVADGTSIGLNQLARQARAVVVGMNATQDDEERGIALRLLEIGFLPGEMVRVVAHGYPGHDPLAVRVGHTTFALRSHEAALVQVRLV
jgi:ferrous iron transport protein A